MNADALPLYRHRALLARYLGPQWRRVVVLGTLLLGGIGLQLANPQILRRFIDAAQAGEPLQTLLLGAVLFLVVAFVQQVLGLATTYMSETVGWEATNRLRADLTLHCLRLDLSFHRQHRPGEMIERIDGDVNTLANFFSQFVIRVSGNFLLLLGVLALLYREDVRLGAGFTVFAAISFVILNRVRNLATPFWRAAREASANLMGFIEERLTGTEDIRAGGFTEHVLRRLYGVLREKVLKQRKASYVGTFVGITTTAVFTVGYIGAIAASASLYGAGLITIGTVYMLLHYTEMLNQPLQQITNQIQDLQRATASIGRIDELLATRSALVDAGTRALPDGPLPVTFDGVGFAYEERTVLQDVSFHLEAGRVLGLVGRTGSGKTTITRLLFRFHDPTQGSVRLGGLDLRDVPLGALRERVAVVTQDVQLFHAPLRDNLTLFDCAIPDARIVEAIEALGLLPWYAALRSGLDTELAAGGAGLSAGEAQLVAFIRVFLRDPGLVILDEASSRLDPATERLIESAIHRLMAGRTAVVVAHRLATVRRADAILVLEDGRVVEHGPRAALAADPNSRFGALLRAGTDLIDGPAAGTEDGPPDEPRLVPSFA